MNTKWLELRESKFEFQTDKKLFLVLISYQFPLCLTGAGLWFPPILHFMYIFMYTSCTHFPIKVWIIETWLENVYINEPKQVHTDIICYLKWRDGTFFSVVCCSGKQSFLFTRVRASYFRIGQVSTGYVASMEPTKGSNRESTLESCRIWNMRWGWHSPWWLGMALNVAMKICIPNCGHDTMVTGSPCLTTVGLWWTLPERIYDPIPNFWQPQNSLLSHDHI